MIAVVTGASSGIGKETARELARRDHRVAIVCRNPAKGKETLAELDGDVDLFLADLSELAQVRKLADDLHAAYDHIDVLVNNAGVNSAQREVTREGHDRMMATNYLAPFLLTQLLGDLLRAADQGRVVNVASEAHRFAGKIDFDQLPDLGEYRGGLLANRAYALTKLLLILHTRELARRLEGTDITANSLCPGLVATNLVGAQAMITRVGGVLSRTPLVRTPHQGARMSIKLAIDPTIDVSGRFFTSTPAARVLPLVGALGDRELQRELWDRTEEWLSR